MSKPLEERLGLQQVSVLHGGKRRWATRAVCNCGNHLDVMVIRHYGPSEITDKIIEAGWLIKGRRTICPQCQRPEFKTDPTIRHIVTGEIIGRLIDPPAIASTEISYQPIEQETAMEVARLNEPQEPDRFMKRKIHDAISGEWDEARGRYMNATSDQAIATKLNCPRKWVEDIRVDFFGDSGANEDLEDVKVMMSKAVERFEKTAEDALKIATNLDTQARELKELRSRLERVEKSVLPRGR